MRKGCTGELNLKLLHGLEGESKTEEGLYQLKSWHSLEGESRTEAGLVVVPVKSHCTV